MTKSLCSARDSMMWFFTSSKRDIEGQCDFREIIFLGVKTVVHLNPQHNNPV